MATYSGLRTTALEIINRIQANRQRLDGAKASVTVSKSDLDNMATAYTQFVTDVNAYLAANPSDVAAQALKAEKDALVAEFNTLRTGATNFKTAADAITY